MTITKFNYLTSIKLQKQIKQIIKQQSNNYKFINLDFFQDSININFQHTNPNKSKTTLYTISLENQIYPFQSFYNIKKYFIIDYQIHQDFKQTYNLYYKLPSDYFLDFKHYHFNNSFLYNPSFLK
jgi:hypothetical protein